MKKYLAEMVGTMVLVLMGCGSAVFNNGCGTTAQVLTVAFAFGLSVVVMAYTIGGISGCHINPAITLGCMVTKRIGVKDGLLYMLFQVIGGFIGSAIIFMIVNHITPDMASYIGGEVGEFATKTGANACQDGVSLCGGLIAEIVFTAVFVLVVLGTTDSEKGAGQFAGLAIGLSLVLVHIVCIPLTGTSVNPARSIAPAVFNGGEPLHELWIFIVGPLVGALIAALVWKLVSCDCCCCKKKQA
ncbi:MAG: MIP family channel protein [Prevotellaceae bacterium]|nr:MIP family channel protein [Prevotellaceae bacterium]